MTCCRILVTLFVVHLVGAWTPRELAAQQFFTGSASPDSQYSGGIGVDTYGRVVNADGRLVDRYGFPVDDYGRPTNYYNNYGMPSHSASGSYYTGGYSPGGFSGLGYSNGLGYSVGLGSALGGYYSSSRQFGSGVGSGVTYIAPPRTIVVGGGYPSRTVMNNATRGGVVEYTNNGNGYVYSSGTSSQSVLSSGPSIFPSTSVVQPSQPPVIIQTRPLPSTSGQPTSRSYANGTTGRNAVVNPAGNNHEIKLICPKESAASMTYMLNGTVYSIKPGYSQTFAEDRTWTIEFLRSGNGSQPLRYDLRAGTYQFVTDENGWDLKSFPRIASPNDMLPPPPPPSLPSATPLSSSTLPPLPSPAPTPSPDL